MSSLSPSADFRVSSPAGSTPAQVASEAPHLISLTGEHPDLLIYTASSPAYSDLRPFYNCGPINQPGAIVRPRTESEVAAIIQHAKSRSIPFGLRAGGHDLVAAQLQGSDGVIIDLRALDSVVIADDKRSARVGGGILGIALSRFLHEHKLLTPHPWNATVGMAGWALGGGYGYASAFYGLGADQILGARVVLGSGDVVDTNDHPELLWALRGAGNGGFGVVVELRLKVYPETGYLGGLLAYGNDDAEQVLTKFGEIEKKGDVPMNFSSEWTHMTLPGVGPVLAWVFVWTSKDENVEEGWTFHAKLKALGTPILDTVGEVDDYTFYSSFPSPSGNHIHLRLRNIDAITPEVANIIAARPPPGPVCATISHNAHGRAIEENPDACFPLRKPHRIINPYACTPVLGFDAAEFAEYKKWNDGMVDVMDEKKLVLPFGHRNLGPECDVKWAAYFGESTLGRLREVKRKFDPENVFRTGFPRLDLV